MLDTNTPVKLSESETIEAIGYLPPHSLQARRMVEYLSISPYSPSGRVAHICGIGNLSDIARKANAYLFLLKLFISCERPSTPIINKFGEHSDQWLWSIYRVPEAANDPVYDLSSDYSQTADGQILDGIVIDPYKLGALMNMKDPDDFDELLRVLDLTDETDPDRIMEIGQAYLDHAQTLRTYHKAKSGS